MVVKLQLYIVGALRHLFTHLEVEKTKIRGVMVENMFSDKTSEIFFGWRGVGWFEFLSENFEGGRYARKTLAIRCRCSEASFS
jgi:hypothetical protein